LDSDNSVIAVCEILVNFLNVLATNGLTSQGGLDLFNRLQMNGKMLEYKELYILKVFSRGFHGVKTEHTWRDSAGVTVQC